MPQPAIIAFALATTRKSRIRFCRPANVSPLQSHPQVAAYHVCLLFFMLFYIVVFTQINIIIIMTILKLLLNIKVNFNLFGKTSKKLA